MRKFLGIELGSTRIKAVLVDETYKAIAGGSHNWENRFENGYWTYSLEDVWTGIQESYANLAKDYAAKFKESLTEIDSIGISAMMHGYLPFDKDGGLLAPFRTWRNTTTGRAAAVLSEKFNFNIPLRWSAAHLYQAILDGESHVDEISFITTLAGYVHYRLTGEVVLGICDASGVFPISGRDYNEKMLADFDELAGKLLAGRPFKLKNKLPKVLLAGEKAGTLSAEGAKLLDTSGNLKPGAILCPPEGDAGTGMVATNSVAKGRGNVSAGTSVFAVLALEKEITNFYKEIDIAVSPSGTPLAMVHCNNCMSDLDAWVNVLREAAVLLGADVDKNTLYTKLFMEALKGDSDCGGLFSCNYVSGEHLTGFDEGRPLFVRGVNSNFNLANFMRTHLLSSMATLRIGMDILKANEGVSPTLLIGHGGLFKTLAVGQELLAGSLNIPVAVMEEAGEGGAYGMAILAAFASASSIASAPSAASASSAQGAAEKSLEEYLEDVFAADGFTVANPKPGDTEGFLTFLERYKRGLLVEEAAVKNL